ncbi:MAG TPA: class I adenylate-forming enzyme family protein [Xanthobacteraceae bacterium]|jgi:acyl-coenzyme A synthetase/AMP-(fatty) acid ligase
MLDRTAQRVETLRGWIGGRADRRLHGRETSVALADLAHGTTLGGRLPDLANRSVLIKTADQLTAALALIELDGVAHRLVLCPPDVADEHMPRVLADAEVDAVVTSGQIDAAGELGIRLHVVCHPAVAPMPASSSELRDTEWVMFTSGTSGAPKMVVHTLGGLTGAIKRNAVHDAPVVWATFYDIRRYGGLQIFLRTLIDGASLVLSSADEPVGEHLVRLGARSVTHISGTPSHWRRVLMSPQAHVMTPGYVRLSGEIADQTVLDNLAATYPQARVGHAYASTEAGVGFDVNDGRAGFPASLIGRLPSGVELKVEDGTLRVRSDRTALGYVGNGAPVLADDDGFVDTGDIVELRDGRYYFVGRRNGVINVGGLKVNPEEVEAVINRHPQVRMSLVRARRSPITGALVVADVVLREAAAGGHAGVDALVGEILQLCREGLAKHKVPAMIRVVPSLTVAASGKLARHA